MNLQVLKRKLGRWGANESCLDACGTELVTILEIPYWFSDDKSHCNRSAGELGVNDLHYTQAETHAAACKNSQGYFGEPRKNNLEVSLSLSVLRAPTLLMSSSEK